ncbi:DNA/RNA non-specific endonuclease [Roseobacter sp. EG26]|uniref:DNA/RNA non-specific endonuclease n=1 Tax=Roseobacter sp. EG26 TaxID=3412477 RepID=UPI003CE524CA
MPYDPSFINGVSVPLPQLSDAVIGSALDDGGFVHHSRFSLVFNQDRGFAACVAHNVDGQALLSEQQTSRSFKLDPKILPKTLQVGNNRGYKHNDWDRGHMARRKSLSWGDEDEAAIAERESDFYSNICPQHENLHDDAWGEIEDWMLERAIDDGRACVFTGPVFTSNDPEIINLPGQSPIKIPAGFWKIIVIRVSGDLRAASFLVWQRDYDSSSPLSFSPVLEQVRLTTIEVLTGLMFPALRTFDPLLFDGNQDLISDSLAMARSSSGVVFGRSSPLELTDEALVRINGLHTASKSGSSVFSPHDIVI